MAFAVMDKYLERCYFMCRMDNLKYTNTVPFQGKSYKFFLKRTFDHMHDELKFKLLL